MSDILLKEIPWACSYSKNNDSYALTLLHHDPFLLTAQMSEVLEGFKIDGWHAGKIDNFNNIDEALLECGKTDIPKAYKKWCASFKTIYQ